MLDAALKALEQLLSPPFRAVLLKSIALALILLLALGIVIALILGLYKLLRRTANGATRNDRAVRGDGKMAIVASTPLAHSRSLHVVRVGEELVLVGAAEQAVTPIRVYSGVEARICRSSGTPRASY